MVLEVYVAHNTSQPAGGGAAQAGSSSSLPIVIPEQEDMWESDIYPPEAWDSAAYRSDPPPDPTPTPAQAQAQAPASASVSQGHRRQHHRHRASIDMGGEVWEDDLYSPEAWVYGVEGLDRKQDTSAPTTAAPSQATRQETHEEVYWPNIERYMSKPSGSRPTVTCVICQISQLIIPGLQEIDDKESQEEREVLPCGHVVGASCFEEWENVASPPVTCPVCKAVVD